MQPREIAHTITVALEQGPGRGARIARYNGSKFVAREWLHSTLKYLQSPAGHDSNLETSLADEKRELTETAVWRDQMNRWGHLTGVQTELYRFSTIDLSENY